MIGKSEGYAITTLLFLAAHGRGLPIPSTYLSEETGMPNRFLLNVMRKLVKAGLVTSVFGGDGGFVLAKPITEITLLDVVESVKERLPQIVEERLAAFDGNSQSTLVSTFAAIHFDANRRLASLTMADLMGGNC